MGDGLHSKPHAKSAQSRPRSQQQRQTKHTQPKTAKVNLLYLRKDLSFFQMQCDALLDDKTREMTSEVVSQYGIKIVLRLVKLKVLTKENLDKISDVTSTSPQRVCSAGPSPCRPSPRCSSERSKSENRLSRRDQYFEGKDNVKTSLKFDDEDDIDVRSRKQVSIKKDVSEELYIENVELKATIKDLRSKLASMKEESALSEQQFNSLYTAFANLQHNHAALDSELNKVSIEKEQLENHLDVLDNEIARLNIGEKTRSARHTAAAKEHIGSEKKLKKEMNRCKNERNGLQGKVKSLDIEVGNLSSKLKDKHVVFTLENENLQSSIQRLNNQLKATEHYQTEDFSTRAADNQKEELDKKNEEIIKLTRQLYDVEEKLKSCKGQVEMLENKTEEQSEVILRLSQQLKSSLDSYDRDCNTLRTEIERLKNVEKENDSLEIDNIRLKDQINQLQVQWNKLKADMTQEIGIAEEVMNLKEQKFKLENEKLLMRQEILSFKEKVKTMEEYRRSNEELKSEIESLKASMRRLKSDKKILEEKCKSETTARMTRDDISSKYRDDCDRLRKERSAAQQEVVKLSREKEEFAKRLRTETESLKLGVDKIRNEKSELSLRYKAQLKKEEDKIKTLEKLNQILTKRNQQDMKRHEQDCIKLKKENEGLEDKLIHLKNHTRAADYQKEELDKKNEEIVKLTRQLYDVEEKLKSCKGQIEMMANKTEEQSEVIQRLSQQLKYYVDRSSTSKRLSDIEKENASLKKEIIEAVENLERNRNLKDRYDRDCNTLRTEIERLKMVEKDKDSLEIDNIRLKDQINQIQVQWNKLKADRTQEIGIAEEVMNLKEQKFKMENDKLLMRKEMLSLKEKCKSETTARMTRDDISSKYRDDCDRLRKERSAVQQEVVKLSREREEFAKRLRTETESLKLEVDKTRTNSDETFGQQQAYELLQLKNDYDVCKSQRAQLQEQLKYLKMDNDELEQKLKLKREENIKCKKCDEYEGKLNKAEIDNKELSDKLQGKITDCEKQEQKVLELVIDMHRHGDGLIQKAFAMELDPALLTIELDKCSIQEQITRKHTEIIMSALENQPSVKRKEVIQKLHERCQKNVFEEHKVNKMKNEKSWKQTYDEHTNHEDINMKMKIATPTCTTVNKEETSTTVYNINAQAVNFPSNCTFQSSEAVNMMALQGIGEPENQQLYIESKGLD